MSKTYLKSDHFNGGWINPALRRKIAKQLGAGLSAYAVAKQLGIDAHTVAKYSPFDSGVVVA